MDALHDQPGGIASGREARVAIFERGRSHLMIGAAPAAGPVFPPLVGAASSLISSRPNSSTAGRETARSDNQILLMDPAVDGNLCLGQRMFDLRFAQP